MREIALGHEIVRLNHTVEIISMNTYSNTHDHVLWPLSDTAIDTKEVRALKSLKTEAGRRISHQSTLGVVTSKLTNYS